jgi:hypothetical protein
MFQSAVFCVLAWRNSLEEFTELPFFTIRTLFTERCLIEMDHEELGYEDMHQTCMAKYS